MIGVFVAFIMVVYGRTIYMSLPTLTVTACRSVYRYESIDRKKINSKFEFEQIDLP